MRRAAAFAIVAMLAPAAAAAAEERWEIDIERRMHIGKALAYGQPDDAYLEYRAELKSCEETKPAADRCLSLMLAAAEFAPDPREGEVLARHALDLARRTLPSGHVDIAVALAAIGKMLHAQGRDEAAEAYYRDATEFLERNRAGGAEGRRKMFEGLAIVLTAQGRHQEAEAPLREVLRIADRLYADMHPLHGAATIALARNLNAQHRYAEAEPLFRHILKIRSVVDDTPAIAPPRSDLAANLDGQGRHVEAEPLHRGAIDRATAGYIHRRYARNRAALNRAVEAEAAYRRAVAGDAALEIASRERIESNAALAAWLQTRRRAPAEVRTLLRMAQVGAMARLRAYTGFGPAAQAESRSFRSIFTGEIRAAWDLSHKRR